jgi:hypothetical protein
VSGEERFQNISHGSYKVAFNNQLSIQSNNVIDFT